MRVFVTLWRGNRAASWHACLYVHFGRDPFNQNSNRSDRENWSTSKGGLVFSKLFQLNRTDPLKFGPKFPEILLEWIAPFIPWNPMERHNWCFLTWNYKEESYHLFHISSSSLKLVCEIWKQNVNFEFRFWLICPFSIAWSLFKLMVNGLSQK